MQFRPTGLRVYRIYQWIFLFETTKETLFNHYLGLPYTGEYIKCSKYFNTIVKFPVIPILYIYTIRIYYVTRSNCPEVMRIFRLESHRAQLKAVMGNNMKTG